VHLVDFYYKKAYIIREHRGKSPRILSAHNKLTIRFVRAVFKHGNLGVIPYIVTVDVRNIPLYGIGP
jgi:hypothetical protein